ncbi:hypothetical protein GOBAR_DD27597 [Gossypium barbadense]|nr:hypothetical protein GOBAR_DD27597 [Gossypium barbadense]
MMGVGTVSVGVINPDNCGLLFGVACFWKQDVPTPLVVEAGLVNDGLVTIHGVVHAGHYLLEGWVVARNVDLYLAYCWERQQGYSYSGAGHFNGFIDLQG